MQEFPARRYPIGIQTFSEIQRSNYVYIDKTDMMWLCKNTIIIGD